MNVVDIVVFFITQILGQAYVIMGLITLVGMLLLRKRLSEVFTSTLKTMFGIIILFLGVNGMVGPIITMSGLMNTLFGVTGLATGGGAPIFGLKEPADFTLVGSMTLILAFALQLLVARFTRWKYVYIVGNMMPVWSYGVPMCFSIAIQDPIILILLSSVVCTAYWTIGPALVHQWDKEWIPGASYTLGHCQYIGEVMGGYLGPYIGDPKKESAENIKFPGWLSIFADNTILNTTVLLVMWIIIGVAAGPTLLGTYAGGTWVPIWVLSQALYFTCGLTVILFGVRIMIGQLTMAFEGFREKVVPGAVPAYDCPTVYPYGPQAVTVGFVFYLIGQVLGTLSQVAVHYPYVALPGAFLFFDGATIGVYADKRGGWKTAAIVGIITGMMCIWGTSLQYPLYPAAVKMYSGPGTYGGNLDEMVLWVPIVFIANMFRTVP